ncbi:c2h2 finger domain containing protein [Apiospora arundinis]
MEAPRYAPRAPPPIYIDDRTRGNSGRGHSSYPSAFSPTLASNPMSIPNNRPRTENDIAPPPLPPPRYVPVDGPSLEITRQPPRDNFEGSFKLGSRGFESPGHSLDTDGPNYMRRESLKSIKDEGYHSLASTMNLPSPQDSLPKKLFMSHDQYRPRDSNDYDNSLLKKFSAQPTRRSALSSSVNDAQSRFGASENRQSLLPHLSLPIRPNTNLGTELSDSPMQSAISPRGLPFSGASSNDYRSPIEPADPDRSPLFRNRRTNSGSLPDDATISTQGSYDNMDDTDFPMEETSGIKRLHIDDSGRSEYQRMGLKRRASSPPGDDLVMQSLPNSGELLRRREGTSRQSPTPRLTVIPQGNMSISSISSVGRSGSFASNISLAATSITSGNSYGRISPNGLSPVDGICNSPFSTPISLTHSPQSSISRGIPHHRNLSDNRPLASPRKLSDVSKTTMSRIQGFFMCECCPKKPKKFETAEELSAHAAEKQYECSFCGNRFKNKNEAEPCMLDGTAGRARPCMLQATTRHFTKAAIDPGEADACGYCGDEFARSGGSGRNRHATEQDWDERLRHLQEVHKFRECNSSKKFFRADHFRQHLKHSHAGTSGKWTNMLESACMIEEEPPQPR